MASWQPPIPAGALYSKPARTIGPALALLAYCYDIVQKDGWFELRLKDAAGAMNEPYPTIKRWWEAIVEAKFFAEVQSRGRLGVRVRFKDVWLDWRILNARPDETFGTETGSDVIPNKTPKQVSARNRSVIGTETGSHLIPNKTAYKEDIHDHKTGGETRAKTRGPPAQANIDSLHEGVTAYKQIAKRKVEPINAALIAETVTDIPRWGRCVTAWIQAGLNPGNVKGMTDWYKDPAKMEHRNGTHQSNRPRTAHPNAASRQGYGYERPTPVDPDDTS